MKYRPIALIAAALTLVGCEYADLAGEPVSRNLTWFDYVGAEGLKEACCPAASSRLRFVYKGIYDKQIRSMICMNSRAVVALRCRRGHAASAI